MKKSCLAASLMAALLSSSSVNANVEFNGFANLVAGKVTSGNELLGYDSDINFKQDSSFALQATTDLNQGLSATVQVIARGEDDWNADFEWAYLAYDVTEQTRVVLGRQRAPLYNYSAFLDVSYAYPWITPPEGVYSLQFTSFNGASAIHSFSLGEFDASAQVFVGSEERDVKILDSDIYSSFDNIKGLSLSFERDWLTLKAAYIATDISLPTPIGDAIEKGWQQVKGYEHIGTELNLHEDKAQFFDLGVQINYENWLLISEYGYSTFDESASDVERSLYVTMGYRFDDVLVHATYGSDKNDPNDTVNELPYGLSPQVDQLSHATARVFNARKQDVTSYKLGVTWDFHSSASLKMELSHLDNNLNDESISIVRTALVTIF